MSHASILVRLSGLFSIMLLVQAVPAQSDRGKAEMKAPGGSIVVDYGRPQLKGRDPLSWQNVGSHWRMGMDDMTTLSTPVALRFGATKIAKGAYGLWLLRTSADSYELVFNSETAGMGMLHDKSKDVAHVPLTKASVGSPVESFTIQLTERSGGGTFSLIWSRIKLSGNFEFEK